jgi:hypothetical protein
MSLDGSANVDAPRMRRSVVKEVVPIHDKGQHQQKQTDHHHQSSDAVPVLLSPLSGHGAASLVASNAIHGVESKRQLGRVCGE